MVIGLALAMSLGSIVAILYFFRRRKLWVRAMLVCVALLLLCFLWSAWLGPHELTDPKELADRFELVFQFSPDPQITDIHYRLGDGPDDMVEWFRFTADANILESLLTDLRPTSEQEFRRLSGAAPSWWLTSSSDKVSYFFGSIRTRSGEGPQSRQAWIAYDHTTRVVYCFIHSLL